MPTNTIQSEPSCADTLGGFAEITVPPEYAWLWLVEELHFHACDLDQIVIGKLLCLTAKCRAVDCRKYRAFNMGDKKPGRTPRNHGHLYARLANRGEIFREVQRTAGRSAGKHLNR